jgi:hypothetical protein
VACPASIQRFEDVILVMLDFVILQKPKIFISEASSRMMAFLVAEPQSGSRVF